MASNRFGFSTGALEKGDYKKALAWVQHHHMQRVELSALRYEELRSLVNDLDKLHMEKFSNVSFHAPSSFPKEREKQVISLLDRVFTRGWNIVVHPDVIYTPKLWQHFGGQLLIENMDRRKAMGRTVDELKEVLKRMPTARLCLDMAHARQMDTTLTLLRSITRVFAGRIGEVHISELDSHCRHLPLSTQAVRVYKEFASQLRKVPVIIESMLDEDHTDLRSQEVQLAQEALD